MRRSLRWLIATIMWIPGLLLLAGFGGALHPVGDSLAVFRALLTLSFGALSVLLLLLGGRVKAIAGIALSVIAMFSMLAPASPPAIGGQTVTVYQKNLLRLTTDTRKLQADILASGADIVALQELDARNREILNTLRDDYPFQHVCTYSSGALAVLSRWPAEGSVLPCVEENGLAAMLIDTGRHRLWVASVHLIWPWPYPQAAQARRISSILSGLNEPLVIAGDFNMVGWSRTLRHFARSGGVERAGSAGATFAFRDFPVSIAIDHVYMPKGARAAKSTRRPALGSDHRGVVSEFELP